MHKVAIFILASCILMTLGCAGYTPYYLRYKLHDYSNQHGRYFALVRKAQNPDAKGIIKGVITDMDNGEILPYANVILVHTATGTATDLQGCYEIEIDYPRKYQVQVRMMGYHNITTAPFEVEKGKIIFLNFEMSLEYLYPEGGTIYHR